MAKEKKKYKKNYKKIIINIILVGIGILALAIGLWLLEEWDNNPSKKPVFKVGTETVYLDEVNFCIMQNVINLELDEEALQAKPSDGSTADEYYKEEVIKKIMDYKVEAMMAEKKGISLTKEESKKVKNDAMEYLSQIDARIWKELGIDNDCVIRIYKERYLAYRLREEVTKDIKAEEQEFSTIYLLLFPKVVTTKDGDYERESDGETPIMLPEDEIEKSKANAEKAYQDLLNGKEIEEVAEKYGVFELSGEESNVPDSFGEPFSEHVKKLEEGEISEVIEASSCYAIIKMLKKNDERFADQITKYYESDLKKEAIDEWRPKWYKEMNVKDEPEFVGNVWKKITLYDFVKYMED